MAEVTGFNQLLQAMANADFFTGILPFLLTYILAFIALQRVPVVKQAEGDTNKFSALIAVIIAFFVANFLVQNPVYQSFFSAYLGRIVIGMVGIIGFLVLVSLMGVNMERVTVPVIGVILVFFAVTAFTLSGGIFAFIPAATIPFVGLTLRELFNFTLESGLIWLIVVAAVLFWVTSEPSRSKKHWLPYWFGAPNPYAEKDDME